MCRQSNFSSRILCPFFLPTVFVIIVIRELGRCFDSDRINGRRRALHTTITAKIVSRVFQKPKHESLF
jgi:hypothetical protein